MLNNPNLLDVAVDMMQPNTSAHETRISLTYEGSNITFLRGDGVMVNATQMAKTFGKRPVDWLRLPATKTFLEELTKVRKSHFENLVKAKAGGSNPGTWMHEDVALEFARWLSPKFAIWTNDQIKTLLTTGVATVNNDDETIANAMMILQKRLEAHKQRVQMLEGENTIQKEQIKQLAPKAEYTDSVLQSMNDYTMTAMAKELDFRSTNVFTSLLITKGIMFRQSGRYYLTAKYAGKGYTKTRTHHYTDSRGVDCTNTITTWTEKGRAFLHSLRKGGKL